MNAQRVLDSLAELPLGLTAELAAEDVVARPFTIVGDMPRVDLLTVASTVSFERAWPNRLVRRVEGVRIPYARGQRPEPISVTLYRDNKSPVGLLRCLRHLRPGMPHAGTGVYRRATPSRMRCASAISSSLTAWPMPG